MKIQLNEREVLVEEGASLFSLRDQYDPEADVVVFNGAPAKVDVTLSDGDHVVLIRRGRAPGREELEALMVARHTPGVHDKIKGATVGIAGAGGLGSAVAVALARLGVGRLIVADFDVIEPSNLNRQQYFIDQIGMAKVEALKANIERINPYVEFQEHVTLLTPANISEIFASVDVMTEAFDTPDGKAMLAETFASARPDVPLVMAVGLAGHYSSNAIRTQRLGKNLFVVGDLTMAAQPGTGLMAPRVGIAAHHQANAVLRLLLGEEPD